MILRLEPQFGTELHARSVGSPNRRPSVSRGLNAPWRIVSAVTFMALGKQSLKRATCSSPRSTLALSDYQGPLNHETHAQVAISRSSSPRHGPPLSRARRGCDAARS